MTENACERPNAGLLGDLYAESTDAVYVYDAVTDDWSGFTRFGHAVEVPADAVPLHGRSVAEAEDEVGQVLKANRELHARVDAAEAKLREEQAASANLYGRVFTALGLSVAGPWSGLAAAAAGVRAERDTWESEYERVRDTKLTDLVDAERERDEARENLAESLREYGDVTRLLGEARTRLGGFETYLSRLNAELDEWAERDERFRPLIDNLRAITVPVTDREDPSPVRGCGHSGPCDCPPEGIREASEEPAGETKPRVFLPGDTIPARVAVLDNFGDTQRRPVDWSIGYGTAVEILLPTTADWDDAVWAERESRGHAVERQSDSEEADRADFAKRHRYDANDRDPGFCKCGLAAGAWQHTDTSAYVERPLTDETWQELRGQADSEAQR